MFAPSEKTAAIVREWLVASGISPERITHSDNQGWLAFDATTEEAEALLHAEYHEYEHAPTGNVATACDTYVQFLFSFFRDMRGICFPIPSVTWKSGCWRRQDVDPCFMTHSSS
jgi:Pro-kumamolisin, activation domain